MALGVVMAARSPVVAVVATVYMATTIAAAVTAEEAHLRQTFGAAYDRYARAAGAAGERGASAWSARCATASIARSAACSRASLILALKVAFTL